MKNFKDLKEKLASSTLFVWIAFFLSILVSVLFAQFDEGVDNEKLIILSPCIGFMLSAFLEMYYSYRLTKEAEKDGETGYKGTSVGVELLRAIVGCVLAALAIAGLIL